MTNFAIGFLSSLAASTVIFAVAKFIWPSFKDKCLYNGVRVDGSWDIAEERDGKQVKAGRIDLNQSGKMITGTSVRSMTREGKESERRFDYRGAIHGHQVTLLFEDKKGIGFDTGTYVFTLQNNAKTMEGMTTFHGKKENRIVSEARTLTKVVS